MMHIIRDGIRVEVEIHPRIHKVGLSLYIAFALYIVLYILCP